MGATAPSSALQRRPGTPDEVRRQVGDVGTEPLAGVLVLTKDSLLGCSTTGTAVMGGDARDAELEAGHEVLASLLLPQDLRRCPLGGVLLGVLQGSVELEDVSADPGVAPHGAVPVRQSDLGLRPAETQPDDEDATLGLVPGLGAGVGELDCLLHGAAEGPAPHRRACLDEPAPGNTTP